MLASSCGGDERSEPAEPGHPLTEVVHRLQESFEAEDVEGVCAHMAASARDQAGRVGHAKPTTCVRDVRKVFRMIDGGGGWLDGDKPRVVAVRTDGARASATLTADGWRADVPFVEEAGRWKMEGFFGYGVEHHAELERDFPDRSFPVAGQPVEVSAANGESCGTTSDAAYPRIAGGCVIRVTDKSAPVEMLTPFGGFKFDDCSVDYRVIVDGQGRTWTDEWEIEGGPATGCSDVNPCIRQRTDVIVDRLPWRGRLESDGDGGFVHRMDLCLRTCIGLFAGEFVVDLTPGDGPAGWRVEPSDAGDAGFRLNDSMDVRGEPLKITAAGPADATG